MSHYYLEQANMRKSLWLILILLGIFLLPSEMAMAEASNGSIFVVDMERVLADSDAAKVGNTRLEEARKILAKGLEELREQYAEVEENERRRIIAEGELRLNQQLHLERQAIIDVIATLMREEVKKWRKKNKATLVLPLQNVLDASEQIEITDEIIKAMNLANPEFPALPVVTVKGPEDPPAQKTARKKGAAVKKGDK